MPSGITFMIMVILFFVELIWSVNFHFDFLDVRLPALTTNPLFGERSFFTMTNTNLTFPILITLLIGSGLVFGFSKERREDEMISEIRKECLVWAVYVNYLILIICMFLFFDFDALWLIIINVFTLLIFFVLRFEWKKHQLKNTSDEE
jgi:uncharacterized membrane protein